MNADVKHITYQGKKLPVRVSYYALTKFKEENEGISFDKIKDQIDVSDSLAVIPYYKILIWHSLVAGHHASDTELLIDREKDMDFLIDESLDQFVEVLSAMMPKQAEEKKPQPKAAAAKK